MKTIFYILLILLTIILPAKSSKIEKNKLIKPRIIIYLSKENIKLTSKTEKFIYNQTKKILNKKNYKVIKVKNTPKNCTDDQCIKNFAKKKKYIDYVVFIDIKKENKKHGNCLFNFTFINVKNFGLSSSQSIINTNINNKKELLKIIKDSTEGIVKIKRKVKVIKPKWIKDYKMKLITKNSKRYVYVLGYSDYLSDYGMTLSEAESNASVKFSFLVNSKIKTETIRAGNKKTEKTTKTTRLKITNKKIIKEWSNPNTLAIYLLIKIDIDQIEKDNKIKITKELIDSSK